MSDKNSEIPNDDQDPQAKAPGSFFRSTIEKSKEQKDSLVDWLMGKRDQAQAHKEKRIRNRRAEERARNEIRAQNIAKNKIESAARQNEGHVEVEDKAMLRRIGNIAIDTMLAPVGLGMIGYDNVKNSTKNKIATTRESIAERELEMQARVTEGVELSIQTIAENKAKSKARREYISNRARKAGRNVLNILQPNHNTIEQDGDEIEDDIDFSVESDETTSEATTVTMPALSADPTSTINSGPSRPVRRSVREGGAPPQSNNTQWKNIVQWWLITKGTISMNHKFITQELIDALGIDLSGQDTEALLTHLNETLQERVGTEITEELDDKQLQTLLDMQATATEDEIGEWLEQAVPDLQEIVQDEIDILLGELAENSDGINANA